MFTIVVFLDKNIEKIYLFKVLEKYGKELRRLDI